jgi:tRNA (adenine57-N1/adenine58-N1)-methyltransferase
MTAAPSVADDLPRGTLCEGDMVLLLDSKGRRYLVTLQAGKEFHSHSGVVGHDEIIGSPEGSTFRATHGANYTVLRPTLSEFVLKMPRGAQVIYPKDIGPLLLLADIAPGVRVFESGVGSGALSMGMLRAGAEVCGYELREDFANRARANVERFLGAEALSRYEVQLRNSYEGIDETDFDRVVLDLPEPWQVVPHAARSLRTGGTIVSYSPSILQVTQFRDALDDVGGFGLIDTIEVLHRGWHIEGAAVRPDHRMVAHTGFLTSARRLRTAP